jgi:hypothetical protein
MNRAVQYAAEAAAIICTAGYATVAIAEPCNPVIDGTYCASQPIRPRSSAGSSASYPQIGNSLGSIGAGTGDPATIGAITFQNGTRCIGLLRRGACN